MEEVEDSSPMDPSIFKQSLVRKRKILPQSPQHTMKEAEDSSPVDHTSTKVTLLLSESISTTPQQVSYP